MPWKKSSPDVIARFDAVVAVDGAERGLLFGCPVYTMNGERYATLFGDTFVLRLSPADAAELLSLGGKPFEPLKGKKSKKDRIVVPDDIASNTRSLKAWVKKAVAFANS